MTTPDVTRESLPSLLLVDDDEVLRERLATAIRARGYEVRTAGGNEEALREIAKDSPAVCAATALRPIAFVAIWPAARTPWFGPWSGPREPGSAVMFVIPSAFCGAAGAPGGISRG